MKRNGACSFYFSQQIYYQEAEICNMLTIIMKKIIIVSLSGCSSHRTSVSEYVFSTCFNNLGSFAQKGIYSFAGWSVF